MTRCMPLTWTTDQFQFDAFSCTSSSVQAPLDGSCSTWLLSSTCCAAGAEVRHLIHRQCRASQGADLPTEHED